MMEYSEKYLEPIIKMFFDFVKSRNKKLYANLNTGLSELVIDDLTKGIDFEISKELILLYSFKNGFKSNSNLLANQLLMFDSGLFLSLEQSVRASLNLRHQTKIANKLPIFEDGSGGFLLADCDESSETFNKILTWSSSMPIIEPVAIYDSLTQLMMTTIRCFMMKAYQYNEKFSLEVDYEKFHKIASEFNPQSVYWRSFK